MQYENDMDKRPAGARRHSKRVGRELAMQYLFRCELSGEPFSPESWAEFLEQASAEHELGDNRYGRKCREYAEKLLIAAVEDEDRISETIRTLAHNWSPERIAAVDRCILKVAIAEMYHFPDVPPVVSIDEATAIARDYSDGGACGFINGILNTVKDTLGRPEREGVR